MQGKRVLVVGLGRRDGGVGVARWAVGQGAEVAVTDLSDAEELRDSVAALKGLPIRFVLGSHDEADVDWADLLIRNPAIPDGSRMLTRARKLETPIAMEIGLFLDSTAARVVGITGSKGKTTASFALGHLIDDSFPRVSVAGNMGISALDQPTLAADNVAVLEISSFQAEGMAEFRVAPDVFVVTNLLEDHLDRYSTIERYHEAKVSVLDHQGPGDWAILPSKLDDRMKLEGRARGRRAYFEAAGEPLPPGADGVFASAGILRAHWQGEEFDLGALADLPLAGAHYVSNVAAAASAALAVGAGVDAIRARLGSLPRLDHRQEPVATIDEVEYVNDSAATMPEATAASIRTYAGRDIVLIAGGSSKRLNPWPLAVAVAELARAVVLLEGDATEGIAAALRGRGFDSLHGPVGSMEAAVKEASSLARPGSVVLLAPGATSFGMFEDEFDRGAQFRDAVRAVQIAGRAF
jgi:UDP-N-acetylmuramoylalanine--D-glutamate ligase